MTAVVVTWFSPAALSGLAVALLAAAAALLLVLGGGERRRPLLATAVAGVTFQVVHFAEHCAQLVYWFGHVGQQVWLTPWAGMARDGLAYWCQVVPGQGAGAARGNELLHLAGNVTFLVGAVALHRLIRDRHLGGADAARWCARLQACHVVEHVVLTATLFATGTARGLSTMFGMLDPGSREAIAYRLLFHFLVDLAVTVYVLAAAAAATRSAGAGIRPPTPHVVRMSL